MPRHFDEDDRELIKTELLKKGKKLFGAGGFRKTNVEAIARAAGISKGAFYAFYKTKEEFFFDILMDTEKLHRELLTSRLLESELPVKEAFVKAILEQFMLIEESPILHILARPEEYHLMFEKIGGEQLLKHFTADREYGEWLLGEAGKWAKVRDVDIDAFTGMMRGVAFFVLHRREIGEDVFPGALRLLIEIIADYLFPAAGQKKGGA